MLSLTCRDCGTAHVIGELDLVQQVHYHPASCGEDGYESYSYVWFCTLCPCVHWYSDGAEVHAVRVAGHVIRDMAYWSGRPGQLAARAVAWQQAKADELALLRAQAALLRAQAAVRGGT